MLGLSLLYLLPESIFNSQLVVASGSDLTDDTRIKAVEFFGRAMSGIGASLLVADITIRGKLFTKVTYSLLSLLVITLIIWPTVYFGQKWLIETYLVMPSTAEQRQQAFFSQMLKAGFVKNVVQIEGLPNIQESNRSEAEMTFLTLFSGLVYADPKMDDILKPQYKNIVSNYVEKHMYDEFDRNYTKYKDMRAEIDKYYNQYKVASSKYYDNINNYKDLADKQWVKVDAQIKSGWKKYKKGKEAYTKKSIPLAKHARKDIPEYFYRKRKCSTYSCVERLNKRYDSQINKLGIGYIPPDEWLVEDTRPVPLRRLANAIFGNQDDKVMTYSRDIQHYQNFIKDKLLLKFAKDYGYHSNISSLNEFRSHKKTSDKIRTTLFKNGINLPANWRAHKKNSFYHSVRKKVIQTSKQKWTGISWKKDFNLDPGLSQLSFELSETVQERIKEEMGEEFYVSPMLTNWNDNKFKKKVIDPNIRRQTNRIIEMVESSVVEFEDGQQLEQHGKNAIRSTLVPPISMTLSLFLVVLTIIKLPIKAFSIFDRNNSTLELEKRDNKHDLNNRYIGMFLKPAITSSTILLIFILPLLFTQNVYTQNGSPVNYFLDRIQDQATPLVSYAIKWALHTQPIVFPAGDILEQHLGVMEKIDNYVESLTLWDEAILGIAESKK